ncbi:MAG: ankyrin repeat domain-containing protein [Rickettsiales bacterium]|jgi:ankyrin repeat protein|nr:ankyrin repeat domain-containing protein [Rickettsiales bacterium]
MKNIHEIYHRTENPQELLDVINSDNINELDEEGYSLLEKACYNGQPNLASKLVSEGATLQDNTFEILAKSSKISSSLEIFQILMKKHIKIEDQQYVKKLIRTAISNGHIDLTDELFSKYIEERNRFTVQRSMIKAALANKDHDLMSNYLKLRSVDSSLKNKFLEGAVLSGSFEDVQFLLECDPSRINNHDEGKTLLNKAYDRKIELEKKVIRLEKVKPVSKDKQKEIASYQETIDNLYKSMEVLLSNNSFDIGAALKHNPKILTDSYVASKKQTRDSNLNLKKKVFSKILEHPMALDYLEENGKELVMLAAKHGDKNIYEYIRDNCNISIDVQDSLGNTQILYAAKSGSNIIFDELKDEASLGKNKNGTNILMAACEGYNHKIIEYGLKKADPRELDLQGNNALHYLATHSGEKSKTTNERGLSYSELSTINITNVITDLLNSGVGVDHKNKKGLTPLMLAVINNNVDLVKILLERGADINAVDKQGNTPLIYACALNKKEMIETVLSENNLDITHKNNNGNSAYLISAQRDWLESEENHEEIEKALNKKVSSDKNSYPNLTQTLLSRGADPYEVEVTSIFDAALFVSTAISLAKIGGVVEYYTKDEKFPGVSVVGKAIKMTSALAAGRVAAKYAREVTKKYMTRLLTRGQNDHRMDLNNKVMIGSVHDRGIGFVKHGNTLKKSIQGHGNFKQYSAIYNIDEFKNRTDNLKNTNDFNYWVVEANKDLTDQYIALQHRIKNQPWYYKFPLIWKSIALKKIEKNILEAHDYLRKETPEVFKIDGKNFEKEFSGLIEVLKSSESSRKLLNAINHKDNKNIKELIQGVVNREILVSPATYNTFLKFSQAEKQHCLQSSVASSSEIKLSIKRDDIEKFRNATEELLYEVNKKNKINDEPKARGFVKGAIDVVTGVTQEGIIRTVEAVTPGGTLKEKRDTFVNCTGNLAAMVAQPFVTFNTLPERDRLATIPYIKDAVLVGGVVYSTVGSSLSSIASTAYSVVSNNPQTSLAVVGVGAAAVALYRADYLPTYAQITSRISSKEQIKKDHLLAREEGSRINIKESKIKDFEFRLEKQWKDKVPSRASRSAESQDVRTR